MYTKNVLKKGVSKEPPNIFPQKCPQKYPQKLSIKSVHKKCPQQFSTKNVQKMCPKNVSTKSVQKKSQKKVSARSVPKSVHKNADTHMCKGAKEGSFSTVPSEEAQKFDIWEEKLISCSHSTPARSLQPPQHRDTTSSQARVTSGESRQQLPQQLMKGRTASEVTHGFGG